jgi:hypothetical protein
VVNNRAGSEALATELMVTRAVEDGRRDADRRPDACAPRRAGRLARLPAVQGTERPRLPDAQRGIEPIGKVAPHGLRRTFAALRSVVGDDPAYTAAQTGHEDPALTLRVYTHAVKRLSGAELQEFSRALEWAQWAQTGTNDAIAVQPALAITDPENKETRHFQRAS